MVKSHDIRNERSNEIGGDIIYTRMARSDANKIEPKMWKTASRTASEPFRASVRPK